MIVRAQRLVRVAVSNQNAGTLTRHNMETLAFHARICLHVTVISGRDPHHVVECQFKALARALRDAIALAPRIEGIPSTKGAL